MSERLDLIESLLLQTAQSQRVSQQQLDQLTLKLDQLTDAVEANTAAIADLTRDYRANVDDMIETIAPLVMQTAENSVFIRGLQIENQRILRELRDRRRGTE